MVKIQDVDIPYLEFAEAAAPGTPAAGIVRIYAKTDSVMYQKDDAGAETAMGGGGGGLDSGTSFPGSPASNDLFYRTDRDLIYFYDGTRWLTTTLYREPGQAETGLTPLAATAVPFRWIGSDGTTDKWLDTLETLTYHASPTGTNFWDLQLVKGTAAESEANVGGNPNTSADVSVNWTRHDVSIGALLGTTNRYLRLIVTKHASGANIYVKATLTYRLVG